MNLDSILIGDADTERFELVNELLQAEFAVEVLHAEDFEGLRGYLARVNLLLLTDNLPDSRLTAAPLPLESCFMRLTNLAQVHRLPYVGYLYEEDSADVPERDVSASRFLITAPVPRTAGGRNDFVGAFNGILRSRRLPSLDLDDDPVLRQQIRSLDSDRRLERGKAKLAQLVGRFAPRRALRVLRLNSGVSGAVVFRIKPMAEGPGEFVIKLSETAWKLAEEVKGHQKVREGIPGYRQHFPRLLKPSFPGQHEFMVSYGGWYALCYEFLGGKDFGPMLDLHGILTGSPQKWADLPWSGSNPPRQGTDFRAWILDIVLDWLAREWCEERAYRQPPRKPWTPEDAPEREYVSFPPYRLSASAKHKILVFLDGPEAALGDRLLPKWESLSDRLRRFVVHSSPTYASPMLDNEISMLLSPAHGDLNSNNILLCIRQQDPVFLIDFATFKDASHALQDFARLETEVKYALMDRQQDTPVAHLPALDFTPGQLALWCMLEDHLRSGSWRAEGRPWGDGFQDNVDLSLGLIRRVRAKAERIQAHNAVGESVPSFADEYWHAILYYTLRAITYESLSLFKRLFAVYSSAKLLEQANF